MHTAGASSLRTAAAAVDPEVEPPPLPSVAAVLEVIQGMVRYVVACQLLPESDWDKPPEIKGLAGMTEDRFRRIAEQLSFLPAHTQTGLLKLQRLLKVLDWSAITLAKRKAAGEAGDDAGGTTMSKRELYYSDVKLFGKKQASADRAIEQCVAMVARIMSDEFASFARTDLGFVAVRGPAPPVGAVILASTLSQRPPKMRISRVARVTG